MRFWLRKIAIFIGKITNFGKETKTKRIRKKNLGKMRIWLRKIANSIEKIINFNKNKTKTL